MFLYNLILMTETAGRKIPLSGSQVDQVIVNKVPYICLYMCVCIHMYICAYVHCYVHIHILFPFKTLMGCFATQTTQPWAPWDRSHCIWAFVPSVPDRTPMAVDLKQRLSALAVFWNPRGAFWKHQCHILASEILI